MHFDTHAVMIAIAEHAVHNPACAGWTWYDVAHSLAMQVHPGDDEATEELANRIGTLSDLPRSQLLSDWHAATFPPED